MSNKPTPSGKQPEKSVKIGSTTPPPISLSTKGKNAKVNALPPGTIGYISWNKNAIAEQSAKHFNVPTKVRFTMTLDAYEFTAHLDPNDIQRQQQKRLAQLDVLGGVVVQDFGYKAEILEVKGTTGSKYYDAINQMNDIFLAQTSDKPKEVQVTLDGTSYSAVLMQFNFGRQINQGAGNLINYSMQFIVLAVNSVNSTLLDTVVKGSSVVKSNTANNASKTLSGKSTTRTEKWTKSLAEYVTQNTESIVKRNGPRVIGYINDYWTTLHPGQAYPPPFKALGKDGKFTRPINWSDVLPKT